MVKMFLLAATLVVSYASAANAVTCSQRAAFCVQNRGTQAQCYANDRLAQCEKTGLYTAPSGRVWPATATTSGRKR